MTQDRIVWLLGLIGSLLAFALNQAGVFPAEWYKWINFASGAIAVISGFLGQSPLPKSKWTPEQRAAYLAKKIVGVLLAISVGLGAACAPKVWVLTPQGQVAYTATQIGTRIGEFQNTVIDAYNLQAIPQSFAVPCVIFTVSALKTLKATPEGWAATVATGWAKLKATVPPPTNPAVAAAWGAVDVILATLAAQPPKEPIPVPEGAIERGEAFLVAQGVN